MQCYRLRTILCDTADMTPRTHCKSSHGSRCIFLKCLARREEGGAAHGSIFFGEALLLCARPTQSGASREATRRAGVLLPCGYVARSSRSRSYATAVRRTSTPRRKAKSLPARPVSTFDMSSNTIPTLLLIRRASPFVPLHSPDSADSLIFFTRKLDLRAAGGEFTLRD